MDKEIRRLQAICFWLIDQCVEKNATEMKISQEEVVLKKKKVGDWEIIVKKSTPSIPK